MRKMIYSFLFGFLFLVSCSATPYWKFKTLQGDSVFYYTSEWRCFYEPSGVSIWVECYKKESTDISFFYANSVEYIEDK